MAGFCDDSQSQKNTSKWIDPLGPRGARGTGAPQMRDQLFGYLRSNQGAMNQAGQDFAGELKSAATDPGFRSAGNLARREIAGDYLGGSPELNRAMAYNRAASISSAADQDARIRSNYGRNGMAFSTGAQQAQQAGRAAANTAAEQTNAQAYLQNYLAERANQNNAVNALAAAKQAPLSYLSGVSNALISPLTQAGNLLSGLSSGGQVISTGSSGTYSPSLGSDIMNGVGAL